MKTLIIGATGAYSDLSAPYSSLDFYSLAAVM
jgi:hypothetical protein